MEAPEQMFVPHVGGIIGVMDLTAVDPNRVPSTIKSEIKHLISLSWLLILSSLIQYFGASLLILIIVGHMDHGTDSSIYLSAVALAEMYASLTGESIILGVASAIDTLATQALGHADESDQLYQKRELSMVDIDQATSEQINEQTANEQRINGPCEQATSPMKRYQSQIQSIALMTHRTTLILCCASAIILSLWFNVSTILVHLGQDATICHLAQQYIDYVAIGLPALILSEVLKRYLIAQKCVVPLFWISLMTLIVQTVVGYVLLFVWSVGFIGAPISLALSQWTHLILIIGYIVYIELWYGRHIRQRNPSNSIMHQDVIVTNNTNGQIIGSFNRQELYFYGFLATVLDVQWHLLTSGWKPILQQSLPGWGMLLLEWLAFEVCTFLSGLQGPVELASINLALVIVTFLFMLPLGLGTGASTNINHYLATRQYRDARTAAHASMYFTLVMVLIELIVLLSCGYWVGLARIFTSDQELIDQLTQLTYIISLCVVLDAIQCVCASILRGLGMQTRCSILSLIGYYFIGVPVTCILIYSSVHLSSLGILIGLATGIGSTAILFAIQLFRLNWFHAHAAAMTRVQSMHLSCSNN